MSEHYEESENDIRAEHMRNGLLALARADFDGICKKWEMLTSEERHDGLEWARRDALKQVAEELDWNDQDAANTYKNKFKEYCRIVDGIADAEQDARLRASRGSGDEEKSSEEFKEAA